MSDWQLHHLLFRQPLGVKDYLLVLQIQLGSKVTDENNVGPIDYSTDGAGAVQRMCVRTVCAVVCFYHQKIRLYWLPS